MSLRVAVTGARGFIGQHVVAALAARGDTAVEIRRPFEPATLATAFRGLDAIVHLAGVVSSVNEADFHAGNVDATRRVAEAARDAGVRLVHISSLAAAGPARASAPRSEQDPPTPITTYGRTKLAGERVLAETPGLRWTILRPGVVYGPGDRAMRPLFAYARLGILPLVGEPSAAYTFIYVDDLTRAIVTAVDRQLHGETIFLGHAHPVAPRELMDAIRHTVGRPALLIPIPRSVTRMAASVGDLAGRLTGKAATINSRRFAELYCEGFVCRVDRMRDVLGVVAETGLREGLARASDWYLRAERGLRN